MRLGTCFMALALLATSCAHEPVKRRSYVGEVIGWRSAEGAHFSLTKGPVPLTFLTLRVSDEQHSHAPVRLRVAVTEIYSMEVYGRVGDQVSFRYLEHLPFSGEISFRDIEEYRIVARNGSSIGSSVSGR